MAPLTYVIGDSRAKNLKLHSIFNGKITNCWVKPGANYYDLYEIVDNEFIESQTFTVHTSTPQMYILAGICSLTTVVRGWVDGVRHEEQVVSLNDSENDNILRETKGAISDLQNFILRHDALPIFCTVYPSSISDWNFHRFNKNKTEILLHSDNYGVMQVKLEQMIKEVNEFILERNSDLKVSTPLIHKCLWHNRGPRRNNSFNYSKLVDGIHPSYDLNKKIVNSLVRAMALNNVE